MSWLTLRCSRYGISKLLLSMYTRALAGELEPRGIMVNACCPGWVPTRRVDVAGQGVAGQGRAGHRHAGQGSWGRAG